MNIIEIPLFKRLVHASPFSSSELLVLIMTAPYRYKEHQIEKRRGGQRTISQPTKELKFIQRQLINSELLGLKISDAATAYIKGRSIVDHARLHASNHFLLKLDFNNFFPSITEKSIEHLLKTQTAFSEVERTIIKRLLLRAKRKDPNLRLSIGAPSSPFISNCIMAEFDEIVADYCRDNGLIYSRYADDIAMSTQFPNKLDSAKIFLENLLEKLEYVDLSLNKEKTVNVSIKNRRVLTGLVLSNDGNVSIGRDRKRKIRSQVHAMVNKELPAEEIPKLKGMLAFILSVDRVFVENLAKKYQYPNVAGLIGFEPD